MATYIDWSKYGKAEPEITEECIGQTSLPYDECIGPTGSICYDDCPTGPTGQYNREDVKKRMEESCEDIAPIGITEPCGCDDGPCTEVPCPNYKEELDGVKPKSKIKKHREDINPKTFFK